MIFLAGVIPMERRREPRLDVSWPLHAATISGNAKGTVVNASRCGFLIATEIDLGERELMLLRVELDSSTTIDCVTRIARKLVWDRGFGYGIEILQITPADYRKLSTALSLSQRAAASSARAA